MNEPLKYNGWGMICAKDIQRLLHIFFCHDRDGERSGEQGGERGGERATPWPLTTNQQPRYSPFQESTDPTIISQEPLNWLTNRSVIALIQSTRHYNYFHTHDQRPIICQKDPNFEPHQHLATPGPGRVKGRP